MFYCNACNKATLLSCSSNCDVCWRLNYLVCWGWPVWPFTSWKLYVYATQWIIVWCICSVELLVLRGPQEWTSYRCVARHYFYAFEKSRTCPSWLTRPVLMNAWNEFLSELKRRLLSAQLCWPLTWRLKWNEPVQFFISKRRRSRMAALATSQMDLLLRLDKTLHIHRSDSPLRCHLGKWECWKEAWKSIKDQRGEEGGSCSWGKWWGGWCKGTSRSGRLA